MTDLRTAAQQALDALYDIDATGVPVGHIDLVIDTLKAALEQPEPRNQCGETCERAKLCAVCARGLEQEPVEIKPPNPEGATQCIVRWFAETPAGWVGAWDREALERFTAHPPRREWVSLTDEEMHGLYRRAGLEAYYPRDGAVQYEYERRFDAYARAVEAALKERNT